MKQAEKINQMIESLKELEPAEPSPFMFAKIKHKIAQLQSAPQEFDARLVLRASFGLLLIVVLNISVIYYYSLQNTTQVSTTVPATESDQYVATTDNYYYNY